MKREGHLQLLRAAELKKQCSDSVEGQGAAEALWGQSKINHVSLRTPSSCARLSFQRAELKRLSEVHLSLSDSLRSISHSPTL